MKFKIVLIVGILILIGFIIIVVYQNNKITTLSEYIDQSNKAITLLDSKIDNINTNLESQKKNMDDLLSSFNKIQNNNNTDLTYHINDFERSIYELESTIKALPDVEHKMAYIKHIKKESNQIEIAFDFVECFYGDAATQAAKEDGLNGVYESTGSYIRNKDLNEELFLVPESFIIYVLDGSTLYGSWISDYLSDEAIGYNNGNYRLFNVFLVSNKVTTIEEQYRA